MNGWFSQQPKEQRIISSSSSFAESSKSVQKRINGGTGEDRITSPSGREVATPFRQAYMGRGGAGNGIAEHSRGFRHRAAKQYWLEDQEVLKKYRDTHGPDHITGRGGAGAKGHVNIKGRVPNHERAVAKEKEVMKNWQDKKKANGAMKTGRGGSGNILKNDHFTSPKKDSVSLLGDDDVSNWEPQVEVLESVLTSSDLRQRRNDFSYVHRSSSSSSFRMSQRRPSLLIDTRPRTAGSVSSYDAHSSTRTLSSPMDSSSTFPTHPSSEVSVRTTTIVTNTPAPRVMSPTRIPDEVAPFEEPMEPIELSPDSIEPTRPFPMDVKPKRTKQSKFAFLSLKTFQISRSKYATDPVPYEIPLVYDADPSMTSHPTYHAWSHEMPISHGNAYGIPPPNMRDNNASPVSLRTQTHTPIHQDQHKGSNVVRPSESIGTDATAILTPSKISLFPSSHQVVQCPVPSHHPPIADIPPLSTTPSRRARPLPQPPVLTSQSQQQQQRQFNIDNLPSAPTQIPRLTLLETA